MRELRKFVRLNVNVQVEWKKVKASDTQTKEPTSNITKNISEGGICLIAYEKLKQGDVLELKIELPTRKTIYAKGRIAWVKEFEIVSTKEQLKFDAGLEFTEISQADKEEIAKFVFTYFDPERDKD